MKLTQNHINLIKNNVKWIKLYMKRIKKHSVHQIFYHYSKRKLHNIYKANNRNNNFLNLTIVIHSKKHNKKKLF